MSERCRCHLTTETPASGEWWRPDLDDDPGRAVRAVARYGEDPALRRAIRTDDGWVTKGALVGCYADVTPPMPWQRTGRCWAGIPHAVVACEP